MTFQTPQNNQTNRYKNSSEELQNEICSIWLGRRDSNPRMLGPKPSALPLGHSPIECLCQLRIFVRKYANYTDGFIIITEKALLANTPKVTIL